MWKTHGFNRKWSKNGVGQYIQCVYIYTHMCICICICIRRPRPSHGRGGAWNHLWCGPWLFPDLCPDCFHCHSIPLPIPATAPRHHLYCTAPKLPDTPLRKCRTHPALAPPNLQTLRSSAYGFIYLRTPMYGNFCAKSDFGRIFRFRSLKQLSAEFHHWRPISAELIVECLPPQ